MFDFFRRMIVPIIMIALIGFLATIIFSWGADINSRSKYESSNLAAVINGEEVSWTTYQQVYDNLVKNERQNSDAEISDAKRAELHDNAWSQIQYERLLGQQIAKYNITVSDDELYDFLKYYPPTDFQQSATFQTNGQFDYQKYLSALADPSYSAFWANSEPYFKSEIQKSKLQEQIIQAAHVSENEVKDLFVALNEKIKLGMVNVGYGKYTRPGPTSTDAEYQEYYNSHKEKYNIDERASVRVVIIENKPSRSDWENGLAQIQLIADTIATGADFAEMAKVYSEDGSAASGGDLGWFSKGQMVPEFDRMVFTMNDGDVSRPVKTKFGWHIIKSFGFKTETENGKEVKKAKASHILIKVVASSETKDATFEKLNKFRTEALELGFKQAAVKNELKHQTTEPFIRGNAIQFIGLNSLVSNFVFKNEIDAISPVFEGSTSQYIVQVAEKFPAGAASFEDVKQKVALDLLKEKVHTMCADTANVIWAEIQAGKSMEKASVAHGFEYEETVEFARGEYVKGINNQPEVIGRAFALQNKGDMTGPIEYNQGTVILKLLSKTSVDLNEFTTKRDSLYNVLLVSKQQELFGRWYENLIESSDIVNNLEALRSANRNN